tara:strand:+ start:613 stop:1392 length:780 start_codon:yes stop_codon:yes gene_type:complete
MKICVLVKQVPNEDAIIKLSSDNSGIIQDNLTFCTNEPDAYALEEALLIKENHDDCEVVVCSMGRESVSQILKEALAKGADRGIQINNESSNLDALTNAKIIASAIKTENFDLVLSGLQSDDSGHSQTGIIISEILDMTHAALVVGVEMQPNEKIKVKKELESGWFQWSEMELPSSLSIQSGLNKPRYASLKGIMGAKKKQIDKYNVDDLGIDTSPTKIKTEKMYIPEKSKETQYIEGDTDSIVEELVKILKDDIKAIN